MIPSPSPNPVKPAKLSLHRLQNSNLGGLFNFPSSHFAASDPKTPIPSVPKRARHSACCSCCYAGISVQGRGGPVDLSWAHPVAESMGLPRCPANAGQEAPTGGCFDDGAWRGLGKGRGQLVGSFLACMPRRKRRTGSLVLRLHPLVGVVLFSA